MPQSEAALRGRVFDVQRFSTHDGTGIRTSVFLKGCPLRCMWCQNPEGIGRARAVIWVASSCIGCGTCLGAARNGGIEQVDGSIVVHADVEEDFERIVSLCPANALRWNSQDMTVEEVMDVVRRDAPFYAHGGGGVTLSGGDPLAQSAFAHAILRQCAQEGIHTAVETEMHTDWETAKRTVQLADLVYADIKLYDDALARKYTGAGSARILDNIGRLLQGPFRSRIIVRTPLIPGITATDDNIARIARFISEADANVQYELLNYNPLAAAKYPLVGREFALADVSALSSAQVEHFERIARENGVRRQQRDGVPSVSVGTST